MNKNVIKNIAIVLAIIVYIGCTSPSPRKYIKAGDEAYKNSQYVEAIENYRRAGKEGKEKLGDAYTRELVFTVYYGNISHLEEDLKAFINEELDETIIARVLLDVVNTTQGDERTSEENLITVMKYIPEAYQSEVEELKKTIQEEKLQKDILSESWKEVIELCNEMPDHELAQEILDIYNQLSTKPNVNAVRSLKQIFEADKAEDFWDYAINKNKPATLEDLVQYNLAKQMIKEIYQEGQPDATTLEECYDPETMDMTRGISKDSTNETLSAAMIKELKKLCGTEADGKILIIHDRAGYDTSTKEMDIDWELMEKLPDSYKPSSTKEVKYLMYMLSTYEKGGIYQNGTRQIIEYTELQLFDTETGEVLFKEKIKGSVSDQMWYLDMGNTPKWYSARSPEMYKPLQKAMKIISDMEK